MRLLRFSLGDYRVVQDLDINFDPFDRTSTTVLHDTSYTLDFLVGVNGTGKSTILRALGEIFRRLEGNTKAAAFPFELVYRLDDVGEVLVSNSDAETREPLQGFRVKRGEEEEQVDEVDEQYLPTRIVAFTTGSEAEWETLEGAETPSYGDPNLIRNLQPEERAIREMPGSPVRPETPDSVALNETSRFLLVRASQLPLVTLCGLLEDLAEQGISSRRLQEVLAAASIGGLRGFSLKFRINRATVSAADYQNILRLADIATRTLHLGSDRLLVFDLTDQQQNLARDITREFDNGLQLFETLARLATSGEYEQPILRQTSLFFERQSIEDSTDDEPTEVPPLHLFEWLSDGERSLIGRMCLFSLLGATESLVLLDEPEVHFNDYWKREIVRLLDETLKDEVLDDERFEDKTSKKHSSHLLIATHSGIVLTDVPREDIVVLRRSATYTDESSIPSIETFAGDPGDILVHVFEAQQAAGAHSVNHIQRILEKPQSDRKRTELEQLLEQTGPGYWSYRIRRELLSMESE